MRVQRVLMPDGSESWTVLNAGGDPVPAVEAFLAHLLDRSPTTVRTYATSLMLWLQFLDRLGVLVDKVTVEHVSRFVAWLRAPADNVTVLVGRAGRCGPATVNKHLAAFVLVLRLAGPQRGGVSAVAGGVAAGQPGRLPAVPAPRHRRPAGGHPAAAAAAAAVSPAAADPDRRAAGPGRGVRAPTGPLPAALDG